jgi:cytochrome c oxidase subunit 6b
LILLLFYADFHCIMPSPPESSGINPFPFPVAKMFWKWPPPPMTPEERALFNQRRTIGSAPRDERFPSTNQALHCWNRYNEWLLCVKQSGDEEGCRSVRGQALSLCPSLWVEEFDEQRGEDLFSGIGSTFDEQKKAGDHH